MVGEKCRNIGYEFSPVAMLYSGTLGVRIVRKKPTIDIKKLIGREDDKLPEGFGMHKA